MKKRSRRINKNSMETFLTYVKVFLVLVSIIFIASRVKEEAIIVGRVYDFLGSNTIGINPQTKSVNVSDSLSLEVVVKQVTNVYGVQFDLLYDSSILTFSSIQRGSFLGSTSDTYWIAPSTATAGKLDNAALTRVGEIGGVSGDGIIATITFTAKANGTSTISLSDVIVLDPNGNQMSVNKASGSIMVKIGCTDKDGDGYYAEGGSCGTADCNDNDNSIRPGATEACNNKDDDCDGSIDEGLTRQCGTTDIGPCTYGTETCQAGNWTNCNAIKPTNDICGNAIDEDCNGQDLSCEGDINGDRYVDILDLAIIGINFGKTSGFDQRADVNKDGVVNILDLYFVAKRFGVQY